MIENIVRQQYDNLAAIYDQRWRSYITNTLSFLKTWVNIAPQATVLDVACGTGEFEQLLLAENPTQEIVGVDISEKMLAVARQKCLNYNHVFFHQASVSSLPFDNQMFDVVICASAFHYFDSPETALSEMKRVLKGNGEVVILDWCKDYFVCRLYDLVLPFLDPAYKQCYTQAQFHHLLTSAGFKIQRHQKVRFGFFWELMVATAICYD